jgi:putative oxidoreductase
MSVEDIKGRTDRYAKSIVLIRVLVGWVFLSEGIQKFLFPAALGVGRFAKIGIPAPQLTAPFVGIIEIVFGTLILIGLFTRLATVPLLIVIAVALSTTKLALLEKNGIWSTLHEGRTDVSMMLGLVFLLMVGGGSLALDTKLHSRHMGKSV